VGVKNVFGISRKLLNSDEWLGEVFTKGQAWVDLCGLARWQDGHVMFGTTKIDLRRGQLAWSVTNLAKRWRWSRGKALRQLTVWESKQQVIQAGNRITTVITITNYNEYQFGDTTSDTTHDTTPDTTDDTLKNTENKENVKIDGKLNWIQEQLIKGWKERCPSMRPLDSMCWSASRWHHIKILVTTYAVSGILSAMNKFEASDKLSGRDTQHRGTYGFDWFVKGENFTKVIEGVFENKGKRSSRSSIHNLDKQLDYKTEMKLRELIIDFPQHEADLKHFIDGNKPIPPELKEKL